jgi:hypothetical protein
MGQLGPAATDVKVVRVAGASAVVCELGVPHCDRAVRVGGAQQAFLIVVKTVVGRVRLPPS